MESTLEVNETRVHHGQNVKRVREAKGVKQASLAVDLGTDQQGVSRLEKKRVIDEEILAKIAYILEVPVELLKNMKEDPVGVMIENNAFEQHTSPGYSGVTTGDTVFNNNDCSDKVIALEKENQILYERLLKAEQEKNEYLEKQLRKYEGK